VIAECERFAENAMRWLQPPDIAQVRPIRGLAMRRRRRVDVAGLR
jgi:hypothetical protein